MQQLNPISIPLNAVSLIEASAGTGKTYTMGSLYLRLLLQAGENTFPYALNVEQILVVTFTEMATEELKRKTRERIYDAKQKLTAYQQTQDSAVFGQDDFLRELVATITDLPLAIQRLTLAEQNMDLAAIYTIHGFCRRMLMQYAFNSGIHFNLELSGEEDELLLRLAQKIWRDHFYSQPYAVVEFIQKNLVSPSNIVTKIKKFAGTELKLPEKRPHFFEGTFDEFLSKIDDYFHDIEDKEQRLKNLWKDKSQEISDLIDAELQKAIPKDYKKINPNSFRKDHKSKWFTLMDKWAEEPESPKPNCFNNFRQSEINKQAGSKCEEFLTHVVFEEIDELLAFSEQQTLLSQALWFHYLEMLNAQLAEYKLNHSEKSFHDLLRLLKEALCHPNNTEFAQLIRYQYPFAMIDEFQDTDAVQYQIFSKVYVEPQRLDPASDNGFIMIGDPKQAIYKFRGADIFTYFKAADEAQHRFNLGKNYRSHQDVVQCVNHLFDFHEPSPFLYDKIPFLPVESKDDHPQFWLNGEPEPAVRFYVDEASVKENMAKACAISIQYWLQSAVGNNADFRSDEKCVEKTLKQESIAVLVRDRHEAALVKKELRRLGIASVFLSENSNVFDSNAAKDLLLILTACLNPFSERNILNAVATAIFAQTAADIQRIRLDENRWKYWVEKFIHYQKTWQKQGVLVMLHQLFLQEKITEKLYPTVEGKRLVTDLLHLAELLQEAATLNESEAALLRWFEKQIQGEDRQNEQQVRLESELQLVKIVTIHKSKGLEYDLVWLPFVGYAAKSWSEHISTYYDQKRKVVLWDIDGSHEKDVKQEDFAEQLRLLYVALTRAKYQLNIGVPKTFEEKWSALLYALTQGEIQTNEKPTAYDSLSLLEKLVQRAPRGSIQISETTALKALDAPMQSETQTPLNAATFTGHIEQNWTVTSFSAIEAIHQNKKYHKEQLAAESAVAFEPVFDGGKDYDFNEQATETMAESVSHESAYPFGYSPFDFPHGIKIGTALHRFLEKYDFSQPLNEDKVQKLCQWLQLEETWLPSLQQWMKAILDTPLSADDPTLKLNNLSRQQCVKEMQFYLKLNRAFDVTVFNRALQKHHHLPSETLQFDAIKGMLRGFMDLVFCHNGKYYLVDYKSNFLGVEPQNYVGKSLEQAMLANHYDWQYLFYTLALHRYLQQRDANYHYETHFGGVFYCFLRGMNGENQDGVFFDKPDYALIQALENVF